MFSLPAGRPALMGVLNVTPDSFSDGGRYYDRWAAIDRALQIIDEGADLVDIGGESTRPGAEPVASEEELQRVLPVIEALAGRVPISIDTSKADVAKAALDAGAVVLNDITGLRDPAMRQVAAGSDCSVCVMHLRGDPRTMRAQAVYADVVGEVRDELMAAVTRCETDGIARERIWIDPGLGFAKEAEHNLELLRRLPELVALGYPVLVGASRKSFIGRVLGLDSPDERLEGTLAAHVIAQVHGARVLRVHDVRAGRRALDLAASVQDRRR